MSSTTSQIETRPDILHKWQIQSKGLKSWQLAAGILLSIVSVAIMWRLITINFDLLQASWSQFEPTRLLLIIPIYLSALSIAGLAWGLMMNVLTQPLPIALHLQIFVITHAGRRIPGIIWHVVGRVAWYSRQGIQKRMTALANVLESLLIICSGLVFSIISLPSITAYQSSLAPAIILSIVITGLILHPRILAGVIKKLGMKLEADRVSLRSSLSWFVLYMLIWLLGGTVLFIIVDSMYSVEASLWIICVGAWSLAGVTSMLVQMLPSGLGINEAALSLILSTFIPSSVAVAAALIMRLILTILEFSIALFVIWINPSAKAEHNSIMGSD